jgi:hypothetical protein
MTLVVAVTYFIVSVIDILYLDLGEWYCQNQRTDWDTENNLSVWHQTRFNVTDKNNKASCEDLHKHYHGYHSSSYRPAAILVIMSVSVLKTAVILYPL